MDIVFIAVVFIVTYIVMEPLLLRMYDNKYDNQLETVKTECLHSRQYNINVLDINIHDYVHNFEVNIVNKFTDMRSDRSLTKSSFWFDYDQYTQQDVRSFINTNSKELKCIANDSTWDRICMSDTEIHIRYQKTTFVSTSHLYYHKLKIQAFFKENIDKFAK